MVEALWFFGGAISFQLLSKLFRYGQLVHFTSEVGLYILNLCALIEYDVAYMRALKYKQLLESGVKEEELTLIKSIDERTIENWKNSVVLKFRQTLPRSVRGVFGFKDWQGAMKLLDQHLKREM